MDIIRKVKNTGGGPSAPSDYGATYVRLVNARLLNFINALRPQLMFHGPFQPGKLLTFFMGIRTAGFGHVAESAANIIGHIYIMYIVYVCSVYIYYR